MMFHNFYSSTHLLGFKLSSWNWGVGILVLLITWNTHGDVECTLQRWICQWNRLFHLQSETCSLEIPELELTVGPYALGGRFTTVEGLLIAVKDQLISQGAMFEDSANDETKKRILKFLAELDVVLEGNKEITVVLDDPAGNSYVQVKN